MACVPWRNNQAPDQGQEFPHSRRPPTLCHAATRVTSEVTLGHIAGLAESVSFYSPVSRWQDVTRSHSSPEFSLIGYPIFPHAPPVLRMHVIQAVEAYSHSVTPLCTQPKFDHVSLEFHSSPTIGLTTTFAGDFCQLAFHASHLFVRGDHRYNTDTVIAFRQ